MRLSNISGQEILISNILAEQRKIITFVSMTVQLYLLLHWHKQCKIRKVVSSHVSGMFEGEDVPLDVQYLAEVGYILEFVE